SVKALRVYEQRGLVKPLRSQADWRAYGPEEMARLHQILALKALGLPLARIGELLEGRASTLESVLAIQEQALKDEGDRLENALALIRAARSRLAAGEMLSIDDLTQLTKETTMTTKLSNEEWKEMFEPLIQKNYAPEDLAKASGRHFDQAEVSRQWNTLFEDAKAVMAKGDPYSPEALDVGRRWSALVHQFTQGDPKLMQGSTNVWKDAFADPKVAPRLPVGADVFAFVGKSMQHLKETGQ
ncbi:MAG TPA: MerR family transcriptional regulator, partial [Rhizomicrobium sp.]|nr:MerR family transcriptional regulator [Rhizomicrobium sp.]